MAEQKTKKPSKNNKLFKIYDKGSRKNSFCPKCGTGFIMAKHNTRNYCGNCHYTEFKGKA